MDFKQKQDERARRDITRLQEMEDEVSRLQERERIQNMSQGITQPVREELEHNKVTIAALSREIRQLKEEAKLHEEFVVKCTELIPEGYDGDEAAEAIVLRYLKDIETLAGIIARVTSAYR
jgi:hypothetical protein